MITTEEKIETRAAQHMLAHTDIDALIAGLSDNDAADLLIRFSKVTIAALEGLAVPEKN